MTSTISNLKTGPTRTAAPAQRSRLVVATAAAAAFGLTVALALVAIILVERQTAPRADVALTLRHAAAGPAPAKTGTPSLAISVGARHTGNLGVEVTANLAQKGKALAGATATARFDMVEMPSAHPMPPLALHAVSGRPGLYTGRTVVPMVGTYGVTVDVAGKATGSEHTTVDVGTVATAGQPPAVSSKRTPIPAG